MTEGGRKLVVDRTGVTIEGERFRFRTKAVPDAWLDPDLDEMVAQATESSDMDSVITGLQSMTETSYGQYCGVAKAAELIGERWSMLLVRDLLVAPATFAELQRSLGRGPGDTLAGRLRQLERGGVVRATTRPGKTDTVYELTEYGQELDEIVLKLGRWGGGPRLTHPQPASEVLGGTVLATVLRGGFDAAKAQGVAAGFEMRGDNGGSAHAIVRDGAVTVGLGPVPGGADLVIAPGTHLLGLWGGAADLDTLISDGAIEVGGDPALLPVFRRIFCGADAR